MQAFRFLPLIGLLVFAPQTGASADLSIECHTAFDHAANLILAKHVNAPTRQAMLLAGVRRVLHEAEITADANISRRVSELRSHDEERKFFQEIVAKLPADADREQVIQHLLDGAASECQVFARYIAPRQFRVDTQIRENRYEGIGIQIAQNEGVSTVPKVLLGGPADRCGMLDGDTLLTVDGVPVKDKPLGDIVQMLRGEIGAPVIVEVQQPGKEIRKIEMVRAVVPFRTIFGRDERDTSTSSYRLDEKDTVAYVRLSAIQGSTVRELRELLHRLEKDGSDGLLLDLSGTQPGQLRHAAMIADLFIDEGVLGSVSRNEGEQVFLARPIALFKDKPMAVMISDNTRGVVEWLAAALKDSGRAKLVGTQTAGQTLLSEQIALPDGYGGLHLWTGVLRRSDGRILSEEARKLAWTVENNRLRVLAPKAGIAPDYAAKEPRKLAAEARKVVGDLLKKS